MDIVFLGAQARRGSLYLRLKELNSARETKSGSCEGKESYRCNERTGKSEETVGRENNIQLNWSKTESSLGHFAVASKNYDQGRLDDKVRFWIEEVAQKAQLSPESRILDVGCGTGSFTIDFTKDISREVVGVDPSRGMLAQAKSKPDSSRVEWIVAVAEYLPLADGRFDCIFMSQVLHHITGKEAAVKESLRVLDRDGKIVIRTFSHEQLRQKPVFRFFPEALSSQLRGYTDIPELEAILTHHGYRSVHHYSYRSENYMLPSQYIEAAEKRWWSMLGLLSDEDRQRGIARLREYIRKNGDTKIRNDDVFTMVIGKK
jgi:ubiquinone/menaquinone biosynthesis C-methylase UbiE